MAFLQAFGKYLPARVVGNAEMAAKVNCTPEWIRDVSGIEERRFAEVEESVADMAVAAARDCLSFCRVSVGEIGLLLVSSGSAERRFPGPACQVAQRLGLAGVPAIDLPVASAGSLFGLSLANELAATYRNVLVVAAEKMSDVILQEPMERGVAILFGDGAGACLVSATDGKARIIDSVIATDGQYADDLQLPFQAPLQMNGRSVILQASRKIPAAIESLLERNAQSAESIAVFLMHQANQNLIDRVAKALGVASEKFYSNIRQYGNTSSASMLIAAAEWWNGEETQPGQQVCFAAFGAGFHWGALLAAVR